MLKSTQVKLNDIELNENIKSLLIDHLSEEIDFDDHLSQAQKKALDMFKKGESLCILGHGGVGKSFLIKKMESWVQTNRPEANMYLSATTGISAYSIGGITVHSLLGLGCGEMSIENLLRKVMKNYPIKNRILSMDILVIDEISMLSASLFEKIHKILKTVRKDNRLFGGVQVVLSGDFLQLLPVFKKVYSNEYTSDSRLLIESNIFNAYFTKNNTITLDQNFRQKEDKLFSDILKRVRIGKITKKDLSTLENRLNVPVESSLVTIVSSNYKADSINKAKIKNIDSEEMFYKIKFTKTGNAESCKLLQKELQTQFESRGLCEIILKKGARVMLLKNLCTEIGLVNGAIGTVTNCEPGQVVVKFDNGIIHSIEPASWSLKLGDSEVSVIQIPLLLAYSITIHKCQSLTLEKACLDLNDCFTDHMVYVALSRVKTLSGLYLKSFNHSKITVNRKMKNYLEELAKENS